MTTLVLLAACIDAGPGRDRGTLEAAVMGQQAVDFTIEGSNGQPITLSDYAGDVILLDLSGFH